MKANCVISKSARLSAEGGTASAASTDARLRPHPPKVFKLTYALLGQTLCAGLARSQETDAEFRRRADEIAFLLGAAGADVDMNEFVRRE